LDSGKIAPGQVVLSKVGRDSDRYYIVVGILNSEYVLIADGDLRKIDKPKKKKVKHVVVHNTIANDIEKKIKSGVKVNNSDIRNSLRQLGLTHQSNNKEV
jgi:ribosomal protein L14E/L6E/L27E